MRTRSFFVGYNSVDGKSFCREVVFIFCADVVFVVRAVMYVVADVLKPPAVFFHLFKREVEKRSVVGLEFDPSVFAKKLSVAFKESFEG